MGAMVLRIGGSLRGEVQGAGYVGFFPTSSPCVKSSHGLYCEAEMTPPSALVAALRRLLRPLARFLTTQGITFPMLAELLKQIYVDEAVRHFRLDSEPPSDSRVSLLTGVHRKDVKRLRQSAADSGEAMPEMVALGAQLAAAWTTRKDLRDARGRPRPLPRLPSPGGARPLPGFGGRHSQEHRA